MSNNEELTQTVARLTNIVSALLISQNPTHISMGELNEEDKLWIEEQRLEAKRQAKERHEQAEREAEARQAEVNANHEAERPLNYGEKYSLSGIGTGRTTGPNAFPMSQAYFQSKISYGESVRWAVVEMFSQTPALDTLKFTCNNIEYEAFRRDTENAVAIFSKDGVYKQVADLDENIPF